MTGTPTPKHSETDIAALKHAVDLAAMIGAKVALKRRGAEWVGCCPFHSESTPSFYVVPKKQMFHCFGCSTSGDVFAWLKQAEGLDFAAALTRLRGAPVASGKRLSPPPPRAADDDEAERRKKIEKARIIWRESVPATGTLVETYLASRGLGGMMIPSTLRFHPEMWNAETSRLMPGMVAVVTDARQQIVGVHRTFLRADGGGKAAVGQAKKMLGSCRGAHVWLGLPATGRLAIAEGIETALTVMLATRNLGVWAALSLGNMDAPVPPSVTELILCADGDNKDPKAADKVLEAAVRKHQQKGRVVRIARPPEGKDFNDMVRG